MKKGITEVKKKGVMIISTNKNKGKIAIKEKKRAQKEKSRINY